MDHDDTSGAIEAFRQYTQAFGALDARGVARHFHEPALLITPRDTVALPTVTAVEQAYARVMKDLPQGYARTEFSPLSEHRLSDDLALVTGSGVWKNASNEDHAVWHDLHTASNRPDLAHRRRGGPRPRRRPRPIAGKTWGTTPLERK